MPIPSLTAHGLLPPGAHKARINEIRETFGKMNDRRKTLMSGLEKAVEQFKKAGVQYILIDGSFTTDKELPADIDGCWSAAEITEKGLEEIDIDFWKFTTIEEFNEARKRVQEKYGLDFYIAEWVENGSGKPFSEFFQSDRDSRPKGILKVNLQEDANDNK